MTTSTVTTNTNELVDRLQRACSSLEELEVEALGRGNTGRAKRLHDKREGVKLALSYVLER